MPPAIDGLEVKPIGDPQPTSGAHRDGVVIRRRAQGIIVVVGGRRGRRVRGLQRLQLGQVMVVVVERPGDDGARGRTRGLVVVRRGVVVVVVIGRRAARAA